jgi:Relaxase/Mobilisation nuclease domain
MVANIETSESLSGVLNYNKTKVQHGNAELIHAGNFLQGKNEMNFNEKFEWFQRLNELNTRSKVNMLHVSVNFHPEDRSTKQQMTAIADKYMDAIGLKDQPYLVYQHHDAAHQHFHIVSSLNHSDGKRIRTHNIGRINLLEHAKPSKKTSTL